MIESTSLESPQSVAGHYNELDAFYREIWGLHVHHGYWRTGEEDSEEATVALLNFMMRDMRIYPGKKICDIGCGYGETARFLADHYHVHVTGLSVSKEQLRYARTFHPHPSVELICRDWMQNGLPSNTYDLAISIESSEHMPDLKKFFEESYRVLVPGGTLKVCAWLSKINPTFLEVKHFLEPICTEGRLHLGDENEYRILMESAGFRDIRFEEITENVKKTWSVCLERCAKKFLTDPKYISYLLKKGGENKKFLLSLLRIRLAYERRCMLYGIFTAQK